MNNPKIILQARTGSSRLPRKMIMPFYKDKSVLTILLERLKEKFVNGNIIVATTNAAGDDNIEEIAQNLGIEVFRGSESDVLRRFVEAGEKYQANKIIRVCADNLFLDLDSLELLYKEFFNDEISDYVSFRKSDGTPSIKTHFGFWAEGVTLNALKKVMALTNDKIYHEHVTNYIYSHPEMFYCKFYDIDPEIEEKENLRLTLDTIKDFEVQQFIYGSLIENGKEITSDNIVKFIDNNIQLYDIMHQSIIANSK